MGNMLLCGMQSRKFPKKFLSDRDKTDRMERKTAHKSNKIRMVIGNYPLTKCRRTDCQLQCGMQGGNGLVKRKEVKL